MGECQFTLHLTYIPYLSDDPLLVSTYKTGDKDELLFDRRPA